MPPEPRSTGLEHYSRLGLALNTVKRYARAAEPEELEEIRLAEREIVEAIGNYRTVLKHIDEGGPAQEALTKAAAMTAEVRQALQGLDEEAPVDEVATRLEGRVTPAVLLGVVQFSGAQDVPGGDPRSRRDAVATDQARAMIACVCGRSCR
ncbi:hypothetical protein ACIREE_38520 [Streptomyces sp. NPDC102467]|uniref:hypothetical protein n=1 Tax=Streptomyces sp. NPDC102467 TaxID=3366179 RepID=UPI0037F35E5C